MLCRESTRLSSRFYSTLFPLSHIARTPGRYFSTFPSKLKIGKVSGTLQVPAEIPHPPYLDPAPLTLKTPDQIMKMRSTGQLAAKILNFACEAAEAGITTDEIDRATHNEIIKNGAYPSPLLYKGFPKSICTSINECAAHGIPDDRKLQYGDVINIDITVFKDGVHGDTSRTLIIGTREEIGDEEHYTEATGLLSVAHDALLEGIKQCMPGFSSARIGEAVEELVENRNHQVIPGLVGHGIGEYFHEEPYIAFTRAPYTPRVTLLENMVFTIEPIIKVKGPTTDVGVLEDDWTIMTLDNKASAVFEHTILITANGPEILTLADENASP